MTLMLNKAETSTKWVVTTYEMNPNTTGSTIELFNVATNVTTSHALPADSSPFPERYQEYQITTAQYSGLSAGVYSYVIRDATSGTTETGLLRVVDNSLSPIDDYIVIEGAETDDDYIQ